MRINKLLSNYGICSRKEANRIIEQGRIIVNGKLCEPGQWVEEYDSILLDNEAIKPKKKVYMVLNKPVGVTCTLSGDVENNIINFINYPDYIFPVGRLDKESLEYNFCRQILKKIKRDTKMHLSITQISLII